MVVGGSVEGAHDPHFPETSFEESRLEFGSGVEPQDEGTVHHIVATGEDPPVAKAFPGAHHRKLGTDLPASALEGLAGGEVPGGCLLARRFQDEGAAGPKRRVDVPEGRQVVRGIGEIAEARIQVYRKVEGLIRGKVADIGPQETRVVVTGARAGCLEVCLGDVDVCRSELSSHP